MSRGTPSSRADRYLSWLALVPWPWRSCSSFLARSAQRDTRRLHTATNKHTKLADSVRSAPADDSTTCKASLQRAACNVDATRPEPAAQANGATCVHRSERSQRPSKHGRPHSGLWFLFSRHRTHRVCAYMPMSIRHHEPRSTFMFSCVQTRKNFSPIFCASPSASALHDARACIPDACERDVLTFALPSDRAEPSRCRPPPSPNRDARMAKPNANAAQRNAVRAIHTSRRRCP